MRILVTSICSMDWLSRALMEYEDTEVAALHASFVDLGDFGISRADVGEPAPYRLCSVRVFPVRPYPYSLYLGAAAPLLRSFQPEVMYHVGEPNELGTWQLVRLAHKLCPHVQIVLYSFENVERQWHGFPRCLRGWVQHATIPRLDVVIAASHSAARVWELMGFDPSRIRVVHAFVDDRRFYRRNSDALRAELGQAESFVIGYIGRLVYEKGVDVFLRAVAELPERFVAAIEGRGPVEADLRALAGNLKLAGRVRWLGRIPSEEVPMYMSAFDALVLPSRSIPVWQEQFGRVLPEAMMCETPVVGSSCGAIPEVIGDAGLVFPEGNAAALAQCLLQLAENTELRKMLTQRGLHRAHQEFTQAVMTRRLVGVLREAVALPAR